jgi:hypothetical protein
MGILKADASERAANGREFSVEKLLPRAII